VHVFDLAEDHKLITTPHYDTYVWASAFVLPLTISMAVGSAGLSLISKSFEQCCDVFTVLLSTWSIFLLVAPQAESFGTDSEPMSFDTEPSWGVYMAMIGPLSSLVAFKLVQHLR